MPYTHTAGDPFTPTPNQVIDIDGETWKFVDGQWIGLDYAPGTVLGRPVIDYDFNIIREPQSQQVLIVEQDQPTHFIYADGTVVAQ